MITGEQAANITERALNRKSPMGLLYIEVKIKEAAMEGRSELRLVMSKALANKLATVYGYQVEEKYFPKGMYQINW